MIFTTKDHQKDDYTNLTDEIIAIANQFNDINTARLYHIDSYIGASRYVSDAQLIHRSIKYNGTVLDIGCGAGHMAYLLRRLGHKVIATDIVKPTPYFIGYYNTTFKNDDIDYHWFNILDSKAANPFEGMQFDAICMSGVLEHVSDFGLFLKQLRPLLVQNGKLFIFRFPNRYSWIEKINEYRIGGKVDHPLRFTRKEINLMLRWHGYIIDRTEFEEIFPVNLRGFSGPLRKLYQGINFMLIPLSKLLCKTPPVNQLSTSYRIICRKAFDY